MLYSGVISNYGILTMTINQEQEKVMISVRRAVLKKWDMYAEDIYPTIGDLSN